LFGLALYGYKQVKQIPFDPQVAQGLRQTWHNVPLLAKAKLPRQEPQTLAEVHCKQF
jgi:hypothetical protein